MGVARDLTLGHCGLISPIDMDGSLWDPIGGHDGSGGGLTEDQQGELINASTVVVVLTDPDTAELRTPLGAVITLARHDGPRPYAMCDQAPVQHGLAWQFQASSSSCRSRRVMKRAASALLPPSFWPVSCSSATSRSART